jgi:hypothetical protein
MSLFEEKASDLLSHSVVVAIQLVNLFGGHYVGVDQRCLYWHNRGRVESLSAASIKIVFDTFGLDDLHNVLDADAKLAIFVVTGFWVWRRRSN